MESNDQINESSVGEKKKWILWTVILSIVAIGVVAVVVAILVINMRGDNNISDNNSNKESMVSGSDNKSYPVDLQDKNIYYAMIDGKKIKAGDKISDVVELGFHQLDKDAKVSLPKDRYAGSLYYDASNKPVFRVTAINIADDATAVKDAWVGGISIGDVEYEDIPESSLALDLKFVGDLKLGSTYNDMIEVFGEDYDKIRQENSAIHQGLPYTKYSYSSGYKGFEFAIDDEDRVTSISWTDYSFDR